jgi:hypothetical protein
LEKKFSKYFKDFDLNVMVKMIREKAKHEDVMKWFEKTDIKITTN